MNKPNFIGTFDINCQLCDDLVDYFEKNSTKHRTGQTNTKLDKSVKNSTDLIIKPNEIDKIKDKILVEYFNNLLTCIIKYYESWPFLKETFPNLDIGYFIMQKYNPGGHFKKIHSERTSINSLHRVLVFMTYLNDDFDEGNTYFDHYDLSLIPKKGKTLIWPAEWTHAHRGNEVKNGNKYIITGWFNVALNH